MKSIRHTGTRSDDVLHIEADGCIVNIRKNLTDGQGRQVTSIEIIPDATVQGGGRWILDGYANNRVVLSMPCPATENGVACVYREGHDPAVFAHRFEGEPDNRYMRDDEETAMLRSLFQVLDTWEPRPSAALWEILAEVYAGAPVPDLTPGDRYDVEDIVIANGAFMSAASGYVREFGPQGDRDLGPTLSTIPFEVNTDCLVGAITTERLAEALAAGPMQHTASLMLAALDLRGR